MPIFTFTKGVNGISTPFEIVSTDIDLDNSVLEEEVPLPGNQLQFLYREDGRGNGSSNTGYFLHFRQGTMQTGEFTVSSPSANQRINIEAENINNSDVWLFALDNTGLTKSIWTKVPAVEGNNAIFNSLSKHPTQFLKHTLELG